MFHTDRLFGLIPLDWRLELTRYPIIRRLLKSRWMPFVLLAFNLFMFTVILMAAWVGGVGAGKLVEGPQSLSLPGFPRRRRERGV